MKKHYFFVVLGIALGAISLQVQGPTMSANLRSGSDAHAVRAVAADAFVDSIGVATHWSYPSYATHLERLESLVWTSGIRHVRDGLIPNARRDLAQHGVRETLVIDPTHGLVPTDAYWSAAPPNETYTINEYLKHLVPATLVDALEMPNELDVFHSMYKWHPSDSGTLSTNPSASNYFAAYGEAVTKDCWRVIKSDPSLASIKIIGPTIGTQAPSPYPPGSLYSYVDWGGFHPYPGRANTWTFPQPYDTISKYYWNSFQPSVNVAADPYGGNPLMFTWYQAPFTEGGHSKPMVATETGYQTAARSIGGISTLAHAKYIPRLFAEYFRSGIVRTFIYELYDEGTDASNGEQNFGLIYNDLTPKPAYTALASLIHLLADPGVAFSPGQLAYSLDVQPSGPYTRTKYVHDLLLQKSDGDFYLLLWHEISNTSNTDLQGNPLSTIQRDIVPPSLATTITLSSDITFATLYSYDQAWSLQFRPLVISRNKITVAAEDTVSVIRLSRRSPSANE